MNMSDAEPHAVTGAYGCTYANDLPSLVVGLADAAGGRKIETDQRLPGGYTFLAHEVNERPVAVAAIAERLLAQQAKDGSWITDYDKNAKPVAAANVEATSLAILAVEATTK